MQWWVRVVGEQIFTHIVTVTKLDANSKLFYLDKQRALLKFKMCWFKSWPTINTNGAEQKFNKESYRLVHAPSVTSRFLLSLCVTDFIHSQPATLFSNKSPVNCQILNVLCLCSHSTIISEPCHHLNHRCLTITIKPSNHKSNIRWWDDNSNWRRKDITNQHICWSGLFCVEFVCLCGFRYCRFP